MKKKPVILDGHPISFYEFVTKEGAQDCLQEWNESPYYAKLLNGHRFKVLKETRVVFRIVEEES